MGKTKTRTTGKGSPIKFNGITQVLKFAGSWFNKTCTCLYVRLIIRTCGNPDEIKLGLKVEYSLRDCIGASFSRFQSATGGPQHA